MVTLPIQRIRDADLTILEILLLSYFLMNCLTVEDAIVVEDVGFNKALK